MSWSASGSFLILKKRVRLPKKLEDRIVDNPRYKIQLHYEFFSKGQAMISALKLQYLIIPAAIVGINEGIFSILLFGLGSYLLGRVWFHRYKGVSQAEIQAEVGNQFNKFQQEMRAVYKKTK